MKTYPHGRPPITELGTLCDAAGASWGYAYHEDGDVWCKATVQRLFGRTAEECFFRAPTAARAVEEASKLAKRPLSLEGA